MWVVSAWRLSFHVPFYPYILKAKKLKKKNLKIVIGVEKLKIYKEVCYPEKMRKQSSSEPSLIVGSRVEPRQVPRLTSCANYMVSIGSGSENLTWLNPATTVAWPHPPPTFVKVIRI